MAVSKIINSFNNSESWCLEDGVLIKYRISTLKKGVSKMISKYRTSCSSLQPLQLSSEQEKELLSLREKHGNVRW